MRTLYNNHERFMEAYFTTYQVNILQEMELSEMLMVIIGLLEESMMF
jgi:hypothetical protein